MYIFQNAQQSITLRTCSNELRGTNPATKYKATSKLLVPEGSSLTLTEYARESQHVASTQWLYRKLTRWCKVTTAAEPIRYIYKIVPGLQNQGVTKRVKGVQITRAQTTKK